MQLIEAGVADSQLSLLEVPGTSCRMSTALHERRKLWLADNINFPGV